MATSTEFKGLFDSDGRYLGGDGEEAVLFATLGARYPGKLSFRQGLCVGAEMERGGAWRQPDGSPLDGVRFLLDFDGRLVRVLVDGGRVSLQEGGLDRPGRRQFLANLRVARNLFAHARAAANGPGADPAAAEAAQARAAVWLTPRSVDGFDAGDFPELVPARQQELPSAVQDFLAVAREVPPDQPATTDQYRRGAAALRRILGILEPYLALPDEGEKVEAALGKVPFPPAVVNWDYQLGHDSSDEPCVWVDLYLDDSLPGWEYGRTNLRLLGQIREALLAEGVTRWPYSRVRLATADKVR